MTCLEVGFSVWLPIMVGFVLGIIAKTLADNLFKETLEDE